MTARKPRLPRWVWPSVVAAVGVAGLIWTAVSAKVDGPAASVIVGVCTAIATVLVVILQRTRTADHELKPNSGSSTKDQINRMEHMLQTVLLDVGGIRQENRDDRRATEERFGRLEDRVHDIEHKERP